MKASFGERPEKLQPTVKSHGRELLLQREGAICPAVLQRRCLDRLLQQQHLEVVRNADSCLSPELLIQKL